MNQKIRTKEQTTDTLQTSDSEVFKYIKNDQKRQQTTLNMIPSENYVSKAVRQACGSVMNNKYSEGYPTKRYYQGNENADAIELLAINRAKQLFNADHVNVQPHSGSPANQAVFMATMQLNDTFMGMDLTSGGHLTHGCKVNFSGILYNPIAYGVDEETGMINMNNVRKLAKKHKPKIIISGFTAYPRQFDFQAFHEIAQEIGAIHLADISHISGLIAGGVHPNPFPTADIVSSTTHKTLRGPRGAIIMCKEKYAQQIDKAVFPGLQGGPHDHSIAAKAVAFKEASTSEFCEYAHQIVRNAKTLADTLMERGIKLVTDGTDTHLILIDLRSMDIGLGKQAAIALEKAGICTNANTVPFEPSSPFKPSGVRIGTPTLTTRGMKEDQMRQIGSWMADILHDMENENLQKTIKNQVYELCTQFSVE